MTRQRMVTILLWFGICYAAYIYTFVHPVGAAAVPEVHCTAAVHDDGLVQLDCYGPVMAEVYERLIPRYGVYEALAPIAQEWSFSLEWVEV